ncbi:uncharacterized protein LOC143027833 isoform X2 [Oratosquilla oratoria]|uniref:uncharacterized protein LOC143027833 isoform X2 n=1 Tax=Oratosquilla oratoria TaxID=337810 RepID=UPI003F7617B5
MIFATIANNTIMSALVRPKRKILLPTQLKDYLTSSIGDLQPKDQGEGIANNDQIEEYEQEHLEEDVEVEMRDEQKRRVPAPRPYKCGECKAKYRSKGALQRHLVKHNGEKPFRCSECGKGLSSQYALTEHINIHTNIKPHVCDKCGHESRHLSVHWRHLLTHEHQPSRVYTCTVCTKTFKQNQYLQRHMRKHTGEKPFECAECSKAFTCKSELNRHKKCHSSVRPHVCPACNQGFKMAHNLKNHIRTHSRIQKWKCSQCQAVFTKQKLLEIHKKTHKETVDVVQVFRPENAKLVVSVAGKDKRKVPTVHTIHLSNTDMESCLSEEEVGSKVLRINDTSIPLKMILMSLVKGKSVKIKIVDKQGSKHNSTRENVVALVDEKIPTEEEVVPTGQHGNQSKNDVSDSNFDTKDVASFPALPYSPLNSEDNVKVGAALMDHCMQDFYRCPAPSESSYMGWLSTFSSLCQQLQPPLEPQISQLLCNVASALQGFLLHAPTPQSTGTPDLCPSLTGNYSFERLSQAQYQVIFEHHRVVQQVLVANFSNLMNT